jgi:indolepyruvate ferredoxin oxidoreductase
VDFNIQAFRWGRYAALDMKAVVKAASKGQEEKAESLPKTLEEIITHRKQFLTGYQNKAYAERYESLVRRVQETDKKGDLSKAVAQYYAKLLAVKDEYEVARLYADGTFMKDLYDQFEGKVKLKFYLAPPLFSSRDPFTGELKKKLYGAWMMKGFKVLAKLKGLRGTLFDIFSYSKDRKMEQDLIKEYEHRIESLIEGLTPHNYETAVEIASLPEHIRGYGHVKERHLRDVRVNEQVLLERFLNQG